MASTRTGDRGIGSGVEEPIDLRVAGIAGLLAGLGLLAEFVLFGISGLGATTLDETSTAIPFLQQQGDVLRAAVLAGAANNILVVLLYWGLAQRIRLQAPTLAAAALLWGMVAVVADGLVALSYWRAPTFVAFAGGDPAVVAPAWRAFQATVSAERDVANVFVGFALIAIAIAALWRRSVSRPLGAVALLTGAGAIAGPLGVGAAYLISLLLAIVFRLWAGIELFRTGRSAPTPSGVA
jgi:hypothetical protein